MPKPDSSGHVWYKCKPTCDGCAYCDGGLALCTICGALEGALLSTCPGYKLSYEAQEACYNGNVKDFAQFKRAVELGAHIVNGKVVWR